MENFFPTVLTVWLTQYGSFALFILLALGIFALPIPDETLMLLAGVLMAHGRLSFLPTVIAAFLGASVGISISYTVGRTAGAFLIRKYGRWIGITEIRLQKVQAWFGRIGKWALLVGYFIPGIRHLTGYAAGIIEMPYRHFALFAYTGAFLWVGIFLTLGYHVGDKWDRIEALFFVYWPYLTGILLLLVLIWIINRCISRRSHG